MVIPVGKGFVEYAEEVRSIFHEAHLFVDVDTSGNTLQKKVRSAQLAQYNFIFSKFSVYLILLLLLLPSAYLYNLFLFTIYPGTGC